jgi:hypothetical protein
MHPNRLDGSTRTCSHGKEMIMSHATALTRLMRPIAAIAAMLALVAGLLAPTAAAQTGGSYPPPGDPIGSISGRVVDAATGQPLSASVALYQCNEFGCGFASSAMSFDQGQFRFENQPFVTLPSGAYYLTISLFEYDQVNTAAFIVGPGENYSVGDIALSRIQSIGGISGRIVNGQTGQPVSSFLPDNALLTLLFCSDATTCSPVGGSTIPSDGRFEFLGSVWTPFRPGLYAIEITSSRFELLRTTPVEIAADAFVDLGDVALTLLPSVRSISGRLIDSVTGGPVPGTSDPFAYVTFYRCAAFGCNYFVGSVAVDTTGRFQIRSVDLMSPLLAGDYVLTAAAEQYVSLQGITFSATLNQDVDLGDIKIQPYPVRFSDTQGCQNIPASGGICRYSVRVTNGMTTTLNAASWSVITASLYTGQQYTGGNSTFQPEPARTLRLRSAKSEVLQFSFRVPAGALNGTTICATAYVSADRTTRLFNTIGQRQLFCIVKTAAGPFQRMSEREIRDMERTGRGPQRP